MRKRNVARLLVSAVTNFLLFGGPCSAIYWWQSVDISSPPPGMPSRAELFRPILFYAILVVPCLQLITVIFLTRHLRVGILWTSVANWLGLVGGVVVTNLVGRVVASTIDESGPQAQQWMFALLLTAMSIGIAIVLIRFIDFHDRDWTIDRAR
jgi:hypothetical protein